jgi:hypothetical protein
LRFVTPTATTLVVVLSTGKTFLSCHLFNEDREGPMELFKCEKLNQTSLKFVPLCSLDKQDLIASLKHHLDNSGSLDCILKLKAPSGYDYL